MKGKIALLVLVFAFLFFGCTALEGGGESTPSYSGGSSGSGVSYETASSPTMDYASGGGSTSSAPQAVVIKEGSITVKVPEGTLEDKDARLKGIISQYGGTISDMGYNEYDTEKQYWITVKIAPDKFDSFTGALKDLGELQSMDTSLEDVTEQYSDINTRITNLQTELDRLNGLYDKAENVDEILSIEKEVTRVQTDLDIYQQQKLDLERRAAKSTVRVTLTEEKPAVQKDLFVPLEQLSGVFFGALGAAILLIAGAIGFLLPGVIVLLILYGIYKAIKGRAQKKK